MKNRKFPIEVVLALAMLVMAFGAVDPALATLGSVDFDVVASMAQPSSKEITVALDLAKEQMSPQDFKKYMDRFKGKPVDWQGVIYGTKQADKNTWVLVCTMCSAEALANFDTIFLLPGNEAEGLKKGQSLSFSGKISEIAESRRLQQLIGEAGVGFKFVMDSVELR